MKNLKLLRKEKDITLEELAKETGISNQMLSNYELEKTNPPLETIYKLSKFFNCSIDYLLGHQTNGVLYLDSLEREQRQLVDLIKSMNRDQALITIGFVSDLLQIPYSQVASTKPF